MTLKLSRHVLITCFMKINETMIFLHDVPCLTSMYLFRKRGRLLMLNCLCAYNGSCEMMSQENDTDYIIL